MSRMVPHRCDRGIWWGSSGGTWYYSVYYVLHYAAELPMIYNINICESYNVFVLRLLNTY